MLIFNFNSTLRCCYFILFFCLFFKEKKRNGFLIQIQHNTLTSVLKTYIKFFFCYVIAIKLLNFNYHVLLSLAQTYIFTQIWFKEQHFHFFLSFPLSLFHVIYSSLLLLLCFICYVFHYFMILLFCILVFNFKFQNIFCANLAISTRGLFDQSVVGKSYATAEFVLLVLWDS